MNRRKDTWKDIDLLEVAGMSTNPVDPGRNFATRILNAHVHERPGGIQIRPGYTIKYQKPTDSTITNSTYPNFGLFYDRQGDVDGQEITCLVQKGTLVALDNSGTPIVSDTMNGFWFWCRPYWNLNHWEDGWQLVNKTIITKITAGSNATYPNMIKIFGDLDNHNIDDGTLDRWVIYNKTKDQFAQVITSFREITNTRLNLTRYDSTWDLDDVVILSKYWIDINYQTTLYNLVDPTDIVFHNVNNDIRIGFGGDNLKPGIAIGYRQKYYQIESINFPNKHADINNSTALQNFAEVNELVLDTHILEKDSYGFDLTVSGDGSLTEGVYSFRLTGKMDLYTEQLLFEDFVSVEAGSKISIRPYIYLGRDNPRLTSLKLYVSTDAITYRRIQEITVTKDAYNPSTWEIDQFSRLVPIASALELHSESNAASIASEANSVGSWTVLGAGTLSVSTSGAGGSSYSLQFQDYTPATYAAGDRNGIIFPVSGIIKGELYDIALSLKSIISDKKIYVGFLGDSESTVGRTQEMLEVKAEDFTSQTVELLADDIPEDITKLMVAIAPEHGNDLYLFSDDVYLSQDDGATFTKSSGLGGLPAPVVLGDRMLSFLTNYILASYDHGVVWDQLGSNFAYTLNELILIGDTLYLGDNNGGVYSSTDKGATWTQLSADVSGGSNYPIRGIAKDSAYLYVATVGGGVYRSSDGGAIWSAANTGLTDSNIYSIYADESYVVVVSNDATMAVFNSSDNASNWSSVNTPTGVLPSRMIHDGTYLFVATSDISGATTTGLWRTNDYGVTAWTNVTSAAGITENRGFYDPYLRNGIIYFGSQDTTNGSRLYKTANAGTAISEILAAATSTLVSPTLVGEDNTFWADLISIAQKDATLFSDPTKIYTELNTELGYTATTDLVRGWDQALAYRGRIYYLNPYIDKRYENFLLVSHIHSDGAYMWDISSFSNYRELERFDSGHSLGMVLLPTTEIMIIKDKSVEILSDDGLAGILREPIVGVSCTTKDSIVNLSGIIVWAGVEDIYTYNVSRGVSGILKDTIRDIYLALTNKELLFAIRDRYNTYRLRINDAALKTEFLFFNGFNVIEEKKYLYPEIYREDSSQTLNFLANGNIYGIVHGIDNIGYGKLYAGNYGQRL